MVISDVTGTACSIPASLCVTAKASPRQLATELREALVSQGGGPGRAVECAADVEADCLFSARYAGALVGIVAHTLTGYRNESSVAAVVIPEASGEASPPREAAARGQVACCDSPRPARPRGMRKTPCGWLRGVRRPLSTVRWYGGLRRPMAWDASRVGLADQTVALRPRSHRPTLPRLRNTELCPQRCSPCVDCRGAARHRAWRGRGRLSHLCVGLVRSRRTVGRQAIKGRACEPRPRQTPGGDPPRDARSG
jgi:hypothetical protein